jgi:hypothetical protein
VPTNVASVPCAESSAGGMNGGASAPRVFPLAGADACAARAWLRWRDGGGAGVAHALALGAVRNQRSRPMALRVKYARP